MTNWQVVTPATVTNDVSFQTLTRLDGTYAKTGQKIETLGVLDWAMFLHQTWTSLAGWFLWHLSMKLLLLLLLLRFFFHQVLHWVFRAFPRHDESFDIF